MSVNSTIEWHNAPWRELFGAPQGLPHALLLAGPTGIGKRLFAEALAMRLLCESPRSADAPACGTCPSCRWFASGNHPDYRRIVPEAEEEASGEGDDTTAVRASDRKKASTQIRVDQIRALADFVYLGGHRAGARVVLIQPAEAMNMAAANSLLKILEEPPASVYFLIISDSHRRLLATIRSRCRSLVLARPDAEIATTWLAAEAGNEAADLLAFAGGAPLLALSASQRGWAKLIRNLCASLTDPDLDEVALATRWETLMKGSEGFGNEELVGALQKWLFDLVSLKGANTSRFFDPTGNGMDKLLARCDAAGLLRCYNQLVTIKPLANHPLNPRLFLEDLAGRYLAVFAGARA